MIIKTHMSGLEPAKNCITETRQRMKASANAHDSRLCGSAA